MSLGLTIIGGGGSTGTHLLASILHGVGNVRVGPEINIGHHADFYDNKTFRLSFFKSLIGASHGIRGRTRSGFHYELIPSRILDNRDFYDVASSEALMDLFEDSHCFANLVYNLKRTVSQKHNWPRDFHWIEHSPRNSICAAQFLDTFPREKFIHLVRDGRDVMASQAKRLQNSCPRLPYIESLDLAVQLWCLLQSGAIVTEGHPGYLRISYEDLVREPLTVVNIVLHHLELPNLTQTEFDKQRRADHNFGFSKQEGWTVALNESITDKSVGRWKKDLGIEELKFLESSQIPEFHGYLLLNFNQIQQRLGYEEVKGNYD